MSVATISTREHTVADKTTTTSVKLHSDVVESARIVVAIRGGTITDLLSEILRPVLTKMEKEELAKRSKGSRSTESR